MNTQHSSIVPANLPLNNQGLTLPNLTFLDNFQGSKIRHTDDGLISVFDVIGAVSSVKSPKDTWNYLESKYEDLATKISQVKFQLKDGRLSPKATPVADVETVIEIIMLLPGQIGAQIRRAAVDSLVKRLRGDTELFEEIGHTALRNPQNEKVIQHSAQRIRAKATRNNLVDTLNEYGIYEDIGRITNSIYMGLFGGTKRSLAIQRGLDEAVNLRDFLTATELLMVEVTETLIAERLAMVKPVGYAKVFNICANIAAQIGMIYRPELEVDLNF